MDIEALKTFIASNYDLEVLELEKVKNVYKVSALNGEYCLKVIGYNFSHFKFILSAILHLQKKGFNTIPEIIKTKSGKDYISFDGKYAYLTPWIISRESNYDNPVDLVNAAIKLGELHRCSEGFNLTEEMTPRIYWFTWINTFNTRGREIIDFNHRISQKAYKSEFDKLYLEIMDEELNVVNCSIEHLKAGNYFEIMKKEVLKRGFCHHDYAHHNVLVDSTGDINIIDFDYCILDSRIHDLSSLCIRAMKEGKWDINKFKLILDAYSVNSPIKQDEINLMIAFMEFPQAYWQLGIQYYWEQQPWGEEFFIKKLIKYKDDRDERREFLNTLRNFSLGGSL